MTVIGILPISSELALEIVRRRKMTNPKVEYCRCGGCLWYKRRWERGPIYVGHIRCRGVNPGWFACKWFEKGEHDYQPKA